ncbi:hypothetical protein AHF37_09459 [Paragonimus kellicotti]|nr:hypothetical protein AHF37_09459 [Paragonimus kellicotti]
MLVVTYRLSVVQKRDHNQLTKFARALVNLTLCTRYDSEPASSSSVHATKPDRTGDYLNPVSDISLRDYDLGEKLFYVTVLHHAQYTFRIHLRCLGTFLC